MAWFRRRTISWLGASPLPQARCNSCFDYRRLASGLRRLISAYRNSTSTLYGAEKPLCRWFLISCAHTCIFLFGYCVTCMCMAVIPLAHACLISLYMSFGTPLQPLTARVCNWKERFEQWVEVRLCVGVTHLTRCFSLTLWVWVILDAGGLYKKILGTRSIITFGQGPGGLNEWGLGQVAAIIAWLPMFVQLVRLLWFEVIGTGPEALRNS